MIKILLADDHSIVREGLRRIIDEADDMKVIAEASDGRSALTQAVRLHPNVVILDLSMPGIDGLEMIELLKSQLPKCPILVLTMHEEDQYIVRAIAAGAAGYLTKRTASEQLVKAIRDVYSGKRFLDEKATEALAVHLSRGKNIKSPIDLLTNREVQVLKCIAQGYNNREIAEMFGISVKTVDTHRLKLLNKLNLKNNAELTRFSVQNNLIKV